VEFFHGLVNRLLIKLSKRDEIVKSISNEDDKILIVKVIDFVEQVQKFFEPRVTQFLDPSQILKAKRVLGQFEDVKYLVTSGVNGCERNIIIIYPYLMSEDEVNLPIIPLRVLINSKFECISHRDMLGALMSLGIKREKIGDIIINNNECFIIVFSDISYYIRINLTKIKHASVIINDIAFKEIPEIEQNFKLIASNVASLRLDSILSSGFGESRSSLSGEIIKGNVKVNWEEIRDLSMGITQGDTISLKGKGRIVIDSIGSTTRKGRINIVIKKII
jgi:RNA-binding protein YlmH